MARASFNTLTVAIPATVIPILIAAFPACALAWMEFQPPPISWRPSPRRWWLRSY